MILKTLSYNIHKGFHHLNFKLVLERIRSAVRSTGADLVLLQEVRGSEGDGVNFSSQFEYLADQMWSHYAYGKNAVYASGHHGNAILSKYPIKKSSNINISAHSVESRGVLHAEIDAEGKTLHVVSLHLGLLQSWREFQIQKICDYIQQGISSGEPIVMGGDFNDWTGRATLQIKNKVGMSEAFVQSLGHHAFTYPCWFPFLSLDRIYHRGLNPGRVQVLKGKPWSQLSDHLPLFVEFEGL